MSLPTLVCLKSDVKNKYMRYRHEQDLTNGHLEASAESVMDPYAQFEVQKSGTVDGFVHLKSRFNNMYFVRWAPDKFTITALGYAPDEKRESWGCTLFKPVFVEGDKDKIKLLHLQTNTFARLQTGNACLFVGPKGESGDGDESADDTFTVVDWEAIFKLPRRVAFKGLYSNSYLGAAQTGNKQSGFQFSFKDINDPKVANQIFPNPDGTIYIKSEYYGKFWGLGTQNWIVANQNDPRGSNDNTSAMFKLCASDNNKVALINIKAPMCYCKALSHYGIELFLSPAIDVADRFTWVNVVDLDNA